MCDLTVNCKSLEQTRSLGRRLGRTLEAGTVVALDGTLGSGKTHLTQAIAAGLDIDSSLVVSPTFTLCVPHDGRHRLLHLDAYRIKSLAEVDELALDEAVEDGAVLVVEWAEKIHDALPPVDLHIQAVHIGPHTRQFCLSPVSSRGRGLLENLGD